MVSSIIGWDLGLGGGDAAKELPCPPNEILLIGAKETYPGGTEGYRYANVDIWGFDPRITVVCAIYRAPNPNRTTLFPESNLTATVEAFPLVASKQGDALFRYQAMPAADLWFNGGKLDSYDEGCEFKMAMQGVRIKVSAIRTGETTHDVVMSLQAKPNGSLGCPDLARKLISQLVVKKGEPGKF